MKFRILLFCVLTVLLSSCRDEEPEFPTASKSVVEKTVAVVLPMQQGFREHWERCLALYDGNIQRAYKGQDTMIRLKFELYDERSEDLSRLAAELGRREDIYAVVGGLYSSDAAVMVSALSRVKKTFFTLATSEEIVRAYASTGYLWAMAETDITQSEVLLSRVVNYGGQSVALIVKDDDIYGRTFIDWFAFQARELGLENRGVYTFTDGSLANAASEACHSGADYVICVPSETDEIGVMLEASSRAAGSLEGGRPPRLLFSDTAYGTDVLNLYGSAIEGLEGVAFGADPESGFDISYKTIYGEFPTTGEAQLYDSLMLLGYAAWYQHLHPGVSLQSALRTVVSGEDINMGSWMGEDMSLVVDALAAGASPHVRGASGQLKFDGKIFTNVLSTTYYNYRVYNGEYVILDYNTSDGGNRTDATLAGWNWKASQMQDFDDGVAISYPAQKGNWAVLVASSTGWSNYRHQADVYAIYRRLRESGYPDDRIILIAEDDIASSPSNPDPGVVRIREGGDNVYDDIQIDYRLSSLSPEDFLAIIRGEKSDRLPVVLESNEADNVIIFWSGHGVPGGLSWNAIPLAVDGTRLSQSLRQMQEQGRYRKLMMMIEACYSGSVASQCQTIPGALFITAANEEETSKADEFSGNLNVWMSNRFTSTFIQQIAENSSVSLRDLYYRLFMNTLGSHVMVYNAHYYGNLYSSDMSEFINFM